MITPCFGSSIYDEPVEQCIIMATEACLKHYEINLSPKHSRINTFNNSRILQLQNLSQTHGLSYSFHLPTLLNPGHSITLLQQPNMRHIIKCIKVGSQIGITHITLHLGNFVGHTIMHYFRQGAINTVVNNLKILIEICQEHKVVLAIENSAKIPDGSDMEILGDNIHDFIIIFNQIDSPWLGFCLDIGHANINEGALKYIEQFRNKIRCVHLHDNNGYLDEHLDIGEGTVNWKETTKALKAIEFKGPYISECFKSSPQKAVSLFLKYWDTEKED